MIILESSGVEESETIIAQEEAAGLTLWSRHTNIDGTQVLTFKDSSEHSAQVIKNAKGELNRVDRHQFRILEELIKLLIQNGTIQITDIPQKYRDAYQRRQQLWIDIGEE